jgi:hypothetical protein
MSLYGKDDSNANKTKGGVGIAASSQTKTVVFVDDTEAQLAENKARGLNAPGWWSYVTFTDTHGKTRYKSEHLVTIANPEANASETQSDDTAAADITSVITPGTVASVTTYAPAGAVATFSDNGAADGSRTAGTYTVTNAAGNASGTGADFSVVVAANGDPTITQVSGGTGYADSETITIADASLGGGGGAAVVVTVTAAATAAATFTLSGASSTGSGASLTYQWQKQEGGTGSWSNLSGKTSANTGSLTGLTVAADNGDKYRCRVNNSIGGVEKLSTAGTLTVTDRA